MVVLEIVILMAMTHFRRVGNKLLNTKDSNPWYFVFLYFKNCKWSECLQP